MTTSTVNFELQLPWESTGEEDGRYRRILRNMLSAFVAFALIVPWLPVQPLTREQQVAVPPHLARVILVRKELPKVVPVKPKPAKPKPKLEKKPKQKAKPKPAEKKVTPKPRDQLEQARKVAAVSGVLAFQDSLADMRDSLDIDDLNTRGRISTHWRKGVDDSVAELAGLGVDVG